MAENRDDIWNDDDEELRQQKGRWKRFLLFTLTLVVVLAVVVLAAWRDGTGFDVLRRWFSYGSGGEEQIAFDYDSDRSNRFASVGNSLLVASSTGVELLSSSGEKLYSETVPLTAPSISQGGSTAVVVDSGGTFLSVFNEKGLVYQLTAESGEPFISATMNESDWLAVTSEKTGYKGCVSVYDPGGELAFAFNSSDRFVTNGCVCADNKYLAAVTLGQENSVFLSEIVIYPLDSEEPSATYQISNGLVLQIRNQDKFLVTVADTCLTFADSNGTVKGTYNYAGRYLREYALGGDGFVALLLNRYRAGSTGQVVTVDSSGQELGKLDVEEVMAMSAAGRYLAVLYADSLVIYTSDMTEYARLENTGDTRDVLLRKDGSAVLLGSEQASLYLP